MTTRIFAALAFAGLLTGTASAADLYVPSPEEAIVTASRDWTGFYVGANVGYAGFTAAHGGSDTDVSDLSGWLGGVQAGYNVQVDSLVFGVEADLSAAGSSKAATRSTSTRMTASTALLPSVAASASPLATCCSTARLASPSPTSIPMTKRR